MSGERHALLAAAANPRPATANDLPALSQLYAAAFATDPVMSWVARPGPARGPALVAFFNWLLGERAVPHGEVWMTDDASVSAAWIPPDAPASPGGMLEQLRLMPMFIRLCGISRLRRGSAMGDAMEKNHPHTPHFYLAFIAVKPGLQGLGLGGAMLDTTLKRADALAQPAYLENSNPRNTRLYERAGFVAQKNIAPPGAPPLIAMWRDAKPGGQ